MMNEKQRGGVGVIVAISLLAVCLVGVSVLAFLSYQQAQDYKNNVNQKITAAVTENTKAVKAEEARAYAEESQFPLKPFLGPDTYGSVKVMYPKVWSGYLNSNNSNTPVDFYAHPDIVPSPVGSSNNAPSLALHIEVINQVYSTVIRQYEPLQKQNKVTVKPYSLAKSPTIVGARVDGQLTQQKKGSVVLMPMRDKTLRITTESESYAKQFNEIILPNIEFVP